MFRESKEKACRYLVVALQTDPTLDRPSKCKPVQTWEDRKEILESIRYVDKVVGYDTEDSLLRLLANENHDVRILGDDYRGKIFTGSELAKPIYFCRRDHEYSLTDLKNRVYASLASRAS